ncbi:hypothetical protein BCV69DRAFT_285116 [Microstroma glucosiphilum]|uniref:DUF4187 domain-containing protein n=1 Tax=Pseudomicrostroma glucosiphilum TaxID=1684307 RepID=A0A316TZG4_9BASI|nr:hypothetical protein BCV69DRAFT_285116 [Pseudomicrostroma glucosiphilum]PWN18487.1 hypothetical protein BCV69DRAFT_285116 [Pseudomicrostroma glucosiphilum]
MAPPPPKRKLIDLVKDDADVQPAQAHRPSPSSGAKPGVPPSAHDAAKKGDEEDFMSDAYLTSIANAANAPASKGPRRRHLQAAIPQEPKDEETQRFLGLSKNLMDSGKEGPLAGEDNKAMRMMMLMGYEPGKALGVDRREETEQRELPDESKEATVHEDVPDPKVDPSSALSGPLATKGQGPHLLEPLLPNTSRLGSGVSARRGIGSLSTLISRAAQSHAEAQAREVQQSNQLQDYRARSALLAKETHERKLLERGRRTCWELDTREADGKVGGEEEGEGKADYSPLWLDERWFTSKSEDLPAEVAQLVERAVGDEMVDKEENKPEEAERKQEEGSSDAGGDIPPPAQPVTRRVQTRQFLSLPVSARLAITLDHLRSHHHYCLFCGVQYDSQEDMEATCPGEEEEDHD